MVKSIEEIYEYIKKIPAKKVAVAQAASDHVLQAIDDARQLGIIEPILIGCEESIKKVAYKENIDISGCRIINTVDDVEAVETAVKMVHDKEADILMKGQLQSADFFRTILNREFGIHDGDKLLSILTFMDLKKRGKLVFMTDAAIIPLPSLETKKQLIEGSVDILRLFGIDNPKIAVLSAAETVNKKMLSSTEAYELMQMNEKDEIKNCIVEGPLSFDLALSTEAAREKKFFGKIQGDADVIIVPSLEAGNMLYKALILYSEMQTAGIMMGTTEPVVFSSRTDSAETKRNAIALAIYLSDRKQVKDK